MKHKIKLLRKKLLKRINSNKYKKYVILVRHYELKKSIKYNCNTDNIQKYLNDYEIICYNKLLNKWIEEDHKIMKIISKYIGITKHNNIIYQNINELL